MTDAATLVRPCSFNSLLGTTLGAALAPAAAMAGFWERQSGLWQRRGRSLLMRSEGLLRQPWPDLTTEAVEPGIAEHGWRAWERLLEVSLDGSRELLGLGFNFLRCLFGDAVRAGLISNSLLLSARVERLIAGHETAARNGLETGGLAARAWGRWGALLARSGRLAARAPSAAASISRAAVAP